MDLATTPKPKPKPNQVALLMSLDATDYASWQVAYSLMVWLSMVAMAHLTPTPTPTLTLTLTLTLTRRAWPPAC